MSRPRRLHSLSVVLLVLLFAPSPWDSTVLGRGVGDIFEPDNLVANASTLLPGAVQEHSFHVDGDVDWAKFAVVAGRRYTIYTSLLDFDVDTILELYATNGTTLIDENDDGGSDVWSRLVFTATQAFTTSRSASIPMKTAPLALIR